MDSEKEDGKGKNIDNLSLKGISKKIFGGGVVHNDTDEIIAVAGEDMAGSYRSIYLYPGETTKEKLSDVDAVVILPSQRFRLPGGISETVGSGAIKIRDYTRAVVIKGPLGLSVTGPGQWYIPPQVAKDHGWVPPSYPP
ncbi:MAG: hypothetical protein AB1546_15235 [bacterium]